MCGCCSCHGVRAGVRTALASSGCLWASGRNSLIHVEEGCHFLLCNDCFGAGVQLHGHLEHEGWVVDGDGLVLQLL